MKGESNFTCGWSWKGNQILPVVGRERRIRFYLWLVVKGESDFTCGWSRKRNQILRVTGRERGTRLYLWLVVKEIFTCDRSWMVNQTLPVTGRERWIRFFTCDRSRMVNLTLQKWFVVKSEISLHLWSVVIGRITVCPWNDLYRSYICLAAAVDGPLEEREGAVSYTHLTLPTNHRV